MELHPDFRDLLAAFADADVRYLVVGGYAVGFHGRPRFTKDIDLWVEDSPENLARVSGALARFGAPAKMLEDLREAAPLDVVWMGVPPVRVDVVKGIPGGDFARAYANRVAASWDGVPVTIIGREDLITAKRASGREQDLLDVRSLEK